MTNQSLDWIQDLNLCLYNKRYVLTVLNFLACSLNQELHQVELDALQIFKCLDSIFNIRQILLDFTYFLINS